MARPGELGWLGVERDSPGPKTCPEGAEELSPGFTLGFWLNAEALKRRPLTEAPRNISRNAGGPFRASHVGARFPG
jgi:hypothetical protein